MVKRPKIEFQGSPIFYSLRCRTFLRAGCKKSIDSASHFIRLLKIIDFGSKHYLKAESKFNEEQYAKFTLDLGAELCRSFVCFSYVK
jgi:hypothetical protein